MGVPAPQSHRRCPPIAEFLPSTLLEWEDRVSAAVALQGCNFRCPFCHSAGMVPVERPENEVPWDAVEEHLLKNAGWIDGADVSGGEPTIHAGLRPFIERIAELELASPGAATGGHYVEEAVESGLPVKLDTNGSNPAMLRELVEAGLVQHIALDVKALLEPAEYERATGNKGALDNLRESLEFLRNLEKGAVSYELRTTCVPGILGPDEEEKLLALARELSWARAWFLQPFRPVGCLDPEYEKLPATNPDWLASVAARCREIAPGCRGRGTG